MPPKKDKPTSVASSVASSTASSKPRGKPRNPVSDDAAYELKKQKGRESAAKYRAKQKAMSMGNSAASSVNTAAGSTTLSGAPTGLAQNTFLIDRGSIAGVAKKLEQNEASSIIGKAIKNKLARKKVGELKYDNLMGGGKDGLFDIEIPYKDAKKYFSKDKRMMKYMMMNYGDYKKNIPPADEEGIPLRFRPYSNYDYFEFSYYDEANNVSNASSTANKNYNTKVPRSRDVDYSNYLYNNFITIGKNKEYEPSVGSGSIRGEGEIGAASSNKSMVGSISGDIGQVSFSTTKSSSSSNPVFKVRNARSVSSSPASRKKGTNSSDSSDSLMTASMKRFRKDKAAGKYASSTSSSKESFVYDEDLDMLVVKKKASSNSIGKGSSSSGKVAGSRRF
jgi:hypothetical protein